MEAKPNDILWQRQHETSATWIKVKAVESSAKRRIYSFLKEEAIRHKNVLLSVL
jgi:hypothetical protein